MVEAITPTSRVSGQSAACPRRTYSSARTPASPASSDGTRRQAATSATTCSATSTDIDRGNACQPCVGSACRSQWRCNGADDSRDRSSHLLVGFFRCRARGRPDGGYDDATEVGRERSVVGLGLLPCSLDHVGRQLQANHLGILLHMQSTLVAPV